MNKSAGLLRKILRSRSLRRVVAALMCAVALASVLGTAAPDAFASTIQELQSQRNQLQSQLNAINDDIDAIKDEQAKIKEQQETLKSRIALVQEQIDTYAASIALTEQKLQELQSDLDQKLIDIEETYELFKERVRAMYMSDNATVLSTLLAANSFSEFLVSAEALERVSAHDTELIEQLTLEKQAIEEAQAQVQQQLDVLNEEKAGQEAKYAELAQLLIEANSALSAQQALQEAKQDELDAVQDQFDAIDDEIRELAAQSNGSFIGGNWRWPLPGYYSITSPYGYRVHPITGAYKFHSGVDISGYKVYGAPIIASNTGTVSAVRYYSTGYGYYVMINHGGGWYTLYAHMSSIIVREGQTVTQGQTIGYVGSTGASTGAHLHFEIIKSGSTQNPLDYVSKSW